MISKKIERFLIDFFLLRNLNSCILKKLWFLIFRQLLLLRYKNSRKKSNLLQINFMVGETNFLSGNLKQIKLTTSAPDSL